MEDNYSNQINLRDKKIKLLEDKIRVLITKDISKLQCPKCKDIRYMDRTKVESLIWKWRVCCGILNPVTNKTVGKFVDDIMQLIPQQQPTGKEIREILTNKIKAFFKKSMAYFNSQEDEDNAVKDFVDSLFPELSNLISNDKEPPVVNMPPNKTFPVTLKITSIEKGKPSIYNEVEGEENGR